MKNKAILLLLVCLFAAPLCVFANGTSEENASGEKSTKEVVFFHWRNEDKAVYQSLIDNFQEVNAGTIISQDVIPTSNYYATLKTKVLGEENGDLFLAHNGSEFIALANADAYYPITNEPWISNYPEAVLARSADGQEILGVNMVMNFEGLIINKSIFEEYGLSAPQNYPELLTVCETLKSNGVIPIALAAGTPWVTNVYLSAVINSFTDSQNVISSIESGNDTFYDNDDIRKSISITRELAEKGYFQDGVASTQYEQAKTLFEIEKAAMFATTSASMGAVKSGNPDISMDVIAFPGNDADQDMPIGTMAVDRVLGINKNSELTDTALAFFDYLSRKEVASSYSNQAGITSTVKDIDTSGELLMIIGNAFKSYETFGAMRAATKEKRVQDLLNVATVNIMLGSDMDDELKSLDSQIQ